MRADLGLLDVTKCKRPQRNVRCLIRATRIQSDNVQITVLRFQDKDCEFGNYLTLKVLVMTIDALGHF